MPRIWVTVLLLAPLVASGCDGSALDVAPDDDQGLGPRRAGLVLARVGPRTITLGDLARRIAKLAPDKRGAFRDPAKRRELLDEMIDEELFAQEALARGLDRDEEARAAIDGVLQGALLARHDASLPPPATIGDGAVRREYERHRERYTQPERRGASAIVKGDQASARRLLDGDFEAHMREQGGVDLGQLGAPGDPTDTAAKVPPEVREAVYRLAEVGAVAGPVAAAGRFYVVKLTSRTAAQTRAFERVENGIRADLWQKLIARHRQALLDALRARLGVEVDLPALAAVELPPGFATYVPYWQKPPPGR